MTGNDYNTKIIHEIRPARPTGPIRRSTKGSPCRRGVILNVPSATRIDDYRRCAPMSFIITWSLEALPRLQPAHAVGWSGNKDS
jgi:hypothetical protein